MKEQDVKSISEFLKDFQAETDRGAALVGAAMVESRLERILRMLFQKSRSAKDLLEGANAPLGTFNSKTIICHALGLITDKERDEINSIRKIRNKFAHTLEKINFSTQPISDYCLNLKADTPSDLKSEKNIENCL